MPPALTHWMPAQQRSRRDDEGSPTRAWQPSAGSGEDHSVDGRDPGRRAVRSGLGSPQCLETAPGLSLNTTIFVSSFDSGVSWPPAATTIVSSPLAFRKIIGVARALVGSGAFQTSFPSFVVKALMNGSSVAPM